jgi:hypothetical protein
VGQWGREQKSQSVRTEPVSLLMDVSFGYQQVERGTERSLLWGCVDEEGGRGEARREVSNK